MDSLSHILPFNKYPLNTRHPAGCWTYKGKSHMALTPSDLTCLRHPGLSFPIYVWKTWEDPAKASWEAQG